MPIQQMLLGTGSAEKKTYVDDVFSTYLYTGSGSARTITNGIDLSGTGGMTWIKNRSAGYSNYVHDTLRGAAETIRPDSNSVQYTDNTRFTAFTSSGFSIGTHNGYNTDASDYASFSFLKTPGFFDVVTWTGNSDTNQTISHSLGCIPGVIIAKARTSGDDWTVYHIGARSTTQNNSLKLNESDAANNDNNWQEITSTSFRAYDDINAQNTTYVAYLFAGGDSTAATARSVDFDGTGDGIQFEASSSGIAVGTGNFTLEFWVKLSEIPDSNDVLVDTRSSAMNQANGFQLYVGSDRRLVGYTNTAMFATDGENPEMPIGVWTHIAVVRTASTATKLYINGIKAGSNYTGSQDFDNSALVIGGDANVGNNTKCLISNVRLNKGEGLYSSSFKPPTAPLTTTSQGSTANNVKILACNNSSITGGTVLPATVTSFGNATASTDSPFDDPAGFVFGENGDQNIVKCGGYIGNGSADGALIHCGFEPQWLMIKRTDSSDDWIIWDAMRGVISNGDDRIIRANLNNSEATDTNHVDFRPTGFKLASSNSAANVQNGEYCYIAIRRPDGYVGKPADAGTDVFTMDTGPGSGTDTIPDFETTFPVDFALAKSIGGSTGDWYTSARLMDGKYLVTQADTNEQTGSWAVFDSNVGWGTGFGSTMQSWMWSKNGKGFDVVTYTGNRVNGRHIPHGLGQPPEMIWIKSRANTSNWIVGHKGMNGGTDPWGYVLKLNNTDAQQDYPFFNDFTPTSTVFSTHNNSAVNWDNDYIALLFASVDGISKVGYFNGSSSTLSITTGFQPRFLIVKDITATYGWYVFDSLRGWTSGDFPYFFLDSNSQGGSHTFGAPNSTGFELVSQAGPNEANHKYIYYAHA
jgi:hypothetical protein